MIITKNAISRRTVLRGMGAALALPLLDSMTTAFAAARPRSKATRPLFISAPHGMEMHPSTPPTPAAGSARPPSPTFSRAPTHDLPLPPPPPRLPARPGSGRSLESPAPTGRQGSPGISKNH